MNYQEMTWEEVDEAIEAFTHELALPSGTVVYVDSEPTLVTGPTTPPCIFVKHPETKRVYFEGDAQACVDALYGGDLSALATLDFYIQKVAEEYDGEEPFYYMRPSVWNPSYFEVIRLWTQPSEQVLAGNTCLALTEALLAGQLAIEGKNERYELDLGEHQLGDVRVASYAESAFAGGRRPFTMHRGESRREVSSHEEFLAAYEEGYRTSLPQTHPR